MLRRNFFNDFEFLHASGSFEADLFDVKINIAEVIIPNTTEKK